MTGNTSGPEEDLPLHAEAKARAKWRGGESLLRKDDDGMGIPASEVDAAGASARSEDEDGRPGRGRAGDFPPPD